MDSADPLMSGLTAAEAREATTRARKEDKDFCRAMQCVAGDIRTAIGMKRGGVRIYTVWPDYLTGAVMDELRVRGFEVEFEGAPARPNIRVSW